MIERIARPDEVRRWEGDLPIRHRYTPGVAGEVSVDDLRVGMKVEAVWRPEAERTGSILDIAYFRPAGDS